MMLAPAPRPRFRAAHPLAPMPPRVPRYRLQAHAPTLAWRSAAFYLDRLITPEN